MGKVLIGLERYSKRCPISRRRAAGATNDQPHYFMGVAFRLQRDVRARAP